MVAPPGSGSTAWGKTRAGPARPAGTHSARTHAALDRASDLTEQLRTPADQHHLGARAGGYGGSHLASCQGLTVGLGYQGHLYPDLTLYPDLSTCQYSECSLAIVARDTRASNRLIEPPR